MKNIQCKNCDSDNTFVKVVPSWNYRKQVGNDGNPLPGEYKKYADSYKVSASVICNKCDGRQTLEDSSFKGWIMGYAC